MNALFALVAAALPMATLPATWDAMLADYAKPGVPGATVAVVDHGQVIYSRALGLADLRTAAPATLDDTFYLASMSKQFTAMGIVMLKEEGKLAYDDPISRFFPDFAAPGSAVTVRELLHHTGGLKDYFSLLPAQPPAPLYAADIRALLAAQTAVDFPAGTQYAYSNSGYVMLGQIIEQASGQSYRDFLTSHIFAPLGMSDTAIIDRADAVIPNRAYGFTLGNDGSYQLDDADGDNFYYIVGDGGIYTSVGDLYKWDQALYTDKLVSTASIQDIFTSGTTNAGAVIGYGFGWTVAQSHGELEVSHGGLYDGFHNAILRYPGSQLSVIILTNRAEGDPTALSQAMADAYFAASGRPAR